jgi:hypothetical protein
MPLSNLSWRGDDLASTRCGNALLSLLLYLMNRIASSNCVRSQHVLVWRFGLITEGHCPMRIPSLLN